MPIAKNLKQYTLLSFITAFLLACGSDNKKPDIKHEPIGKHALKQAGSAQAVLDYYHPKASMSVTTTEENAWVSSNNIKLPKHIEVSSKQKSIYLKKWVSAQEKEQGYHFHDSKTFAKLGTLKLPYEDRVLEMRHDDNQLIVLIKKRSVQDVETKKYIEQKEIKLKIFDITDAANPTLTQTYNWEGSEASLAKYKNTLYVVTHSYLNDPNQCEPYPWNSEYHYYRCAKESLNFSKLLERMPTNISGSKIKPQSCLIPKTYDEDGKVNTTFNLTQFIRLDLSSTSQPETVCMIGKPSIALVTDSQVYLADNDMKHSKQQVIHQFKDNDSLSYQGTNVFQNRIKKIQTGSDSLKVLVHQGERDKDTRKYVSDWQLYKLSTVSNKDKLLSKTNLFSAQKDLNETGPFAESFIRNNQILLRKQLIDNQHTFYLLDTANENNVSVLDSMQVETDKLLSQITLDDRHVMLVTKKYIEDETEKTSQPPGTAALTPPPTDIRPREISLVILDTQDGLKEVNRIVISELASADPQVFLDTSSKPYRMSVSISGKNRLSTLNYSTSEPFVFEYELEPDMGEIKLLNVRKPLHRISQMAYLGDYVRYSETEKFLWGKPSYPEMNYTTLHTGLDQKYYFNSLEGYEKKRLLITNQKDYETMLKNLSDETPQTIDFNKYRVVLLGHGHNRGGSSYKLDSVAETNENIRVRYSVSYPGKYCITNQAQVSYYSFYLVPTQKDEVQFVVSASRKDCPQNAPTS